MGQLIDGVWHDVWYDTKSTGGAFERSEARFRDWVTADGGPGPDGQPGHPAAPGRYHLYVSLACPWAHRTLILRALKGLEAAIAVSVVHPDMLSDGWTLDDGYPGATGDRALGLPLMRDVYLRAKPDMTGRVTVPVLYDLERDAIVSNESAEIVRMFNAAFDGLTGNRLDLYPETLRPEIDRVNARVYEQVNNGVYRASFATTQAAYDAAVAEVFDGLDWLEGLLEGRPWLAGDRPTEADVRLFTTLVRFDPVYHGHFKCNRRRLVDYPELWDLTRALIQVPAIAGTVNLDHVTRHYHYSHESVNPHRIVPVGPDLDWDAPARRDAAGLLRG